MPNLKTGGYAAILLTFLCNFAILAMQGRGHGPMTPSKYAPASTFGHVGPDINKTHVNISRIIMSFIDRCLTRLIEGTVRFTN